MKRKTVCLGVEKDVKQLFLAHRRELQSYLTKKLNNADTAADLTQEAFLRFAQYHNANPAYVIANQRSYLYRTAHNLAVDHLRRVSREKTTPVAPEDLTYIQDNAPSPEQSVGDQDELAAIRGVVMELPDRIRQVFVLARLKGLTYQDVATHLGISESSVQKHLAKATKHVMQRIRAQPN